MIIASVGELHSPCLIRWTLLTKYKYRIHEDIKSDNILLFEGRLGSLYDFTPKVADFGLFSCVRRPRTGSSEAKGLDNHGNQRYSTPPPHLFCKAKHWS